MSGIESLRVSQRGSDLDTVDTFTPGRSLSLPQWFVALKLMFDGTDLPVNETDENGSLTLGFWPFWGVLIGGRKLLRASVSLHQFHAVAIVMVLSFAPWPWWFNANLETCRNQLSGETFDPLKSQVKIARFPLFQLISMIAALLFLQHSGGNT